MGKEPAAGLKRVLGTVDASWIVAGNMIGAGIFIAPGLVAGQLPGIVWPLAAWLVGGLLALSGAAVYGELGTRIPRAGGDYQYLAKAFGPLWGFLAGWGALTLSFSAAAAAMSRVAIEFLESSVSSGGGSMPLLHAIGAPVLLLLLTWGNTVGARFAGRTTALLTALPLLGLVGLFVIGTLIGQAPPLQHVEPSTAPSTRLVLAFGAALIPIYFTYSGWNAAAYLAGELRNPGRDLARSLLMGTALVMLFYLVVNLTLLIALPREVLAGSTRAAAEAARLLLGEKGEAILASIISVAILGSVNVTLMAGARIYYAMAADRLAPPRLSSTNRSGVPSTALWVGGIWAALLATFRDVGQLVNWATLAILLLSSMSVASLFVFRKRNIGNGVYRCPGYPVTPLVYLIASIAVTIASVVHEPKNALIGLVIVSAGIPAFFVARKWFGR